MGNKIVTEADRKATKPLPGATRIKQGAGQKTQPRTRLAHPQQKEPWQAPPIKAKNTQKHVFCTLPDTG